MTSLLKILPHLLNRKKINNFGFLDFQEKAKPVDGHLRPHDALQKLAIFEGKYVRLKDERDNVSKAKEALELQEASGLVNIIKKIKISRKISRKRVCSIPQ